MKKILAGILVGLFAVLGSAYLVASSSPTVEAQLHVERGNALVNGKSVIGNVRLSQGDVIKTGDAQATIILHESLLISLEPNSQVTLDDLTLAYPQLSQQAGRTWSTFTRLSGMESYSIKWATTVATVRGTAFEFSERLLVVGDGTVDYLFNGRRYSVTAGRVVDNGAERAATPAEIARIRAYRVRGVAELRYLRELEMSKHPVMLSMAKRLYFDDAKLNRLLDDADNGKIDVDATVAQAPTRPASLMKVANITKAIQTILHE